MSRRRHRPTSVINLNTGRGAHATNHPYPCRTPVLILDFGATSVLVTTSASDLVTADDVAFARQLAREARDFARSVQHMYAALPGNRCDRPQATHDLTAA